MKSFALLLTTICVSILPVTTSAATVTFAQFDETSAGGNIAHFVKNSDGTETLSIHQRVNFQYMGLSSLPVQLQGPLAATLDLVEQTSAAPLKVGTSDFLSSFTGQFSFTLQTPIKGLTNLLSGVEGLTDRTALFGINLGNTASFSFTKASPGSLFSSSFVTFSQNPSQNFSLPFSSVTPSIAVSGARLNPFTAAATGTFASDSAIVKPLPNIIVSPESSSATIFVLGVLMVLPILKIRQAKRLLS